MIRRDSVRFRLSRFVMDIKYTQQITGVLLKDYNPAIWQKNVYFLKNREF